MTRGEALQLALEWAGRGVPAFPAAVAWDASKSKANKTPLSNHGHRDATLDRAELESLFTQAAARKESNQHIVVGLCPGPAGYIVLDDDGGLAHSGLSLPATFRVETASGGSHLWFRKPEPDMQVSNRSPWAGVDVRSDNGWVVAPGSRAAVRLPGSGRKLLSWTELSDFSTAVELPDDVHDRLAQGASKRPTAASSTDTVDTGSPTPVGGHGARHRRLRTADRSRLDPLDRRALEVMEQLGGHNPVLHRDGTLTLTRPGKEAGVSATIGYRAPGVIRMWTSAWPGQDGVSFPADRDYVRCGEGLEAEKEVSAPSVARGTSRRVPGGQFIFDAPDQVAGIWGSDDQVLWAAGEALLIVAETGVGKSTLAVQLVGGLLGEAPDLLGLPVQEQPGRILYLAMDRPRQIQRLFTRRYGRHPGLRELFDERLDVHEGPLEQTFNQDPTVLVRCCREAGASVVIIDSLKDAASGLVDDEAGGAINRAVQLALAEGVQVLSLHHPRKDSGASPSLHDVYGSTLITAGAGSVLMLAGRAGGSEGTVYHRKQPMDEVGPVQFHHDHATGITTVRGSRSGSLDADAERAVLRAGSDGATVKDVVSDLGFDLTDRVQEQQVRRALSRLVKRETLNKVPGVRGGNGGSRADRYVHLMAEPMSEPGTP